MLNKRTVLIILTICSALLLIYAEYFGPQLNIYLFKPLTMVLIIISAVFTRKGDLTFYSYAIFAGLLFSIVGDTFLMLPSDQFVAGLVSFLIAHLSYILAFTHDRKIRFSVKSILPFILYAIFMVYVLSPELGELRIPVMIYIAVIIIMGWQSYERWNDTKLKTARLAFVGALLFIISDSVLALNKFREPFELARALTLCTYLLAQWLIAHSMRQEPAISD